jgi:heterodisulfide reductase subunit C
LQKWIRLSKKVLIKNEKAKAIGKRIQIGWRQSKNLQRITCGIKVGPKKTPSDNPGCFKCGKCKVSCPILEEGNTFSSTNTKKTYRMKHHLTCDSDFVIYLATCQKCDGQYIGKSWRIRKTLWGQGLWIPKFEN